MIKRLVEDALIVLGADRRALAAHRGQTIVLAYHNVVSDGVVAGDRSLHIGVGRFAEHIDALAQSCEVVPLATALAAPAASGDTGGRPRVAITFDDAYLGAITNGLGVLARHGLPATVFVAPGRLGHSFWWDDLSGPDGLPEHVRAVALDACAGDDARVRTWAAGAHVATYDTPVECRAATVEQLGAARAAHDGLTLASHTWSHANLAALDRAAMEEELRRPLAWLRERFAGVPAWIAYPYGLASPEVYAGARSAGYAAGFLVAGGWITPSRDPLALPRLNIPAGLSPSGFRLRLGR